MDQIAPGIQEMNDLQAAGFQPNEIEDWRANTTRELSDAGFTPQETNDYFGEKTPDLSPTETNFKSNLARKAAADAPKAGSTAAPQEGKIEIPIQPEVQQAGSFIEAIEAGFDMSVSGLIKGRPDVVLPENAGMFYRMASQVGTLAGDVPAMIAGSIAGGAAGGAAGSAVPVVGNVAGAVVGAGAGGFALPEAMRTVLMQHYEKGDVKSFGDFWERASAVAINSLKGAVIGGATAGVGAAIGKIGQAALSPAVKTTAQLTAEVTTMTTVGSALEGRVPEPHEFLEAAILVGGLHGAVKVGTKARNVFAKTGMTPVEINDRAMNDAHFKQQMNSSNVPIPENAVSMSGEFARIENPKPPEKFETATKMKESKVEQSDAVKTILSKVGEKTDAPKKSMTMDEVYTNVVDKLDPINQVTKILTENKTIEADLNPYILAREAVDSKAKAKHFFEKGTIDYETFAINGEGLAPILKSLESPEIFESYVISKRVIEKSGQGIETGFDLAAAKAVVKEHGAKYEGAAKRMTEFSNRTLEYVEKAGILKPEQVANMKLANQDYVPFKRLTEREAGGMKAGGKAGSLKEMKGSTKDIQSPILSVVENTIELIKMAELNRPKQALVELARKTEGQTIIELVPERKTPITVKADEIIRALKEQGLDDTIVNRQTVSDILIFRKEAAELAPNQFAVYEKGKRSVYETDIQLAEAINRLGGDSTSTNILFRMANVVTQVKKFGITFTPDFIARNLERDVLTASVFSEGKGIRPWDVLASMKDIWTKNDKYYEWLKSGGANGAFLELGDRYIKTDIYRLSEKTGLLNSVRNLVEKPIDVMRVAAEISEQSVRLAEFKNVREKGGSIQKAGFASREITIDFQRVGAKMSALNSITAFMNVSIQGLDRTARAIKADPVGVGIKAAAYITTPSVLLWWANHDDERYKEIPRWQKDLYWIILTDDWQDVSKEEFDAMPSAYLAREADGKYQINKGTIYRIPKPQELGIAFGSLPERALDAYFLDDPNAFKNFNETMLGLVTPNFVPDAVAPAIEQYFNKSFFTGRDIVPHHLKDVLPEYQFVDYTSEVSKTLGKMVATIDKTNAGASPIVIDNYIRSWGGSLGQYAVQMADKLLRSTGVAEDKTPPTATLSDIPFIKSFVVRFPQAGTNSVQDFYDSYDESNKVLTTIKYLGKQGDFDSMQKELLLNQNQDKLYQLDGLKEALSTQGQFIRMVYKNPEITADEKRQMIDGAYLQMTESAKMGNQILRDIKKQLGETNVDSNNNQ